MVVAVEVIGEDADDGLDIERPGRSHLLEVSPVPRPVEECLEHGDVTAAEEWSVDSGERLPSDPTRHGTVERGRVEKDVDRRRVPPEPDLADAGQFESLLCRGDNSLGKGGEHFVSLFGIDEHVDIDVDRPACPLSAPGERKCPAEGMRKVVLGERTVNGDDLGLSCSLCGSCGGVSAGEVGAMSAQ